MSCTKSAISPNSSNDDLPINDMIRRCVREEMGMGTNWKGAAAVVAGFLDVSPRMIRARCRDELTGPSRRKSDMIEGCWAFLESVRKRKAAGVERLARDIRARRDRSQLTLPLELPLRTAPGSLPRRSLTSPHVISVPANEARMPARTRSA